MRQPKQFIATLSREIMSEERLLKFPADDVTILRFCWIPVILDVFQPIIGFAQLIYIP